MTLGSWTTTVVVCAGTGTVNNTQHKSVGRLHTMGKGIVAAGALGVGAALLLASASRHRAGPEVPVPDSHAPGRRRVVIVGGGWGGIYTALELEKQLRAGEGVDVTLISRENSFLFTPMLPEVAASAISTHDIVNPIRLLLHRTRFVNGDVVEIDVQERKLHVELTDGSRQAFEYEHVVLAMGAETNFFNLPGMREHAINVKTLADAVQLRNHVIDRLEQADVVAEPRRKTFVTFVLCGGGLNGVEVMGGLNDYVRQAVTAYPHIPAGEVRTMIVEAAPRLMPEMDAKLADFTRRTLEKRGVEVWLNARVASADPEAVHLADGRTIDTGTIIWSAGVRPAGLVDRLPFRRDKWNRIVCDDTMRVENHPEVWALGDVAHVPRPGGGENDIYPATAQHALREAYQLGKNIAAVLRGEQPRPFVYPLRVQLATVGHRVGVASIMGFQFSGLVPWWLWRTYYLARLPRVERRLRVTIDWTLDMFFPRDIVQLPLWKHTPEGSPAGAETAQVRNTSKSDATAAS